MSDAQILNLYTSHQRELTKYANSIVGDSCSAEDITQEAYLRFSTAMSHEWRDNPVGYLYRIVRNLALDYCRRARLERALFPHTTDEVAEILFAEQSMPEHQASVGSDLKQLQAVLNQLPERTRIAFEMHRFGGYKLREIAEHLNISSSMAQLLVQDGLKHINTAFRAFPSDIHP